MKTKRANCPHCGPGPATCHGYPHIAHAVLTLFTCGFWSIIWAITWKAGIGEKANCQRCGERV